MVTVFSCVYVLTWVPNANGLLTCVVLRIFVHHCNRDSTALSLDTGICTIETTVTLEKCGDDMQTSSVQVFDMSTSLRKHSENSYVVIFAPSRAVNLFFPLLSCQYK